MENQIRSDGLTSCEKCVFVFVFVFAYIFVFVFVVRPSITKVTMIRSRWAHLVREMWEKTQEIQADYSSL